MRPSESRIVKRSSCASGSGYVPSYSIGFCVAMTMKGLTSSWVSPSIVTWFSCMHSRSAACVFGEARLISSTRSRFANTGPGLNSNSFERWLKTFTPVTSEGRRSGVNWSRENDASSERASAFASIVFPTPGKSSRIRCPSLIRQRTQSRSVSAGACTTVARLSTIRRIASAADSTATGCLSAASSIPSSEQRLGLVEDRGGDPLLRRLGDPPLPLRRDHDHLVLYGVEADVGSPHIVVDDQIGALAVALLPRALEPALPLVGREPDEDAAVASPRGELGEDVRRRLEPYLPRRVVLRALAGVGFGGPGVRARRGHEHEVRVAASQRLPGHVLRGRGLDDLDPGGRSDREVRRKERHLCATAACLARERDAHPPRRAVAEVPHRVERLARPARRDDDAAADERRRPQELLAPCGDRLRLGHPPHAALALGELAILRADQLDAALAQNRDIRLRRRMAPHARVHRGGDEDRPAVREGGLGG